MRLKKPPLLEFLEEEISASARSVRVTGQHHFLEEQGVLDAAGNRSAHLCCDRLCQLPCGRRAQAQQQLQAAQQRIRRDLQIQSEHRTFRVENMPFALSPRWNYEKNKVCKRRCNRAFQGGFNVSNTKQVPSCSKRMSQGMAGSHSGLSLNPKPTEPK